MSSPASVAEAGAATAETAKVISRAQTRLTGRPHPLRRAVTEITSMSCQTHLVDVAHGGLSSLVRRQGWTEFFPGMAKAWEVIGTLKPEFRGGAFRGEGRVLAGIHDSSANYVRYLAGGLGQFTLLSTGTWSISFDTSTTVDQLHEDYDTATNTDIFGRNVATSRFFSAFWSRYRSQRSPSCTRIAH